MQRNYEVRGKTPARAPKHDKQGGGAVATHPSTSTNNAALLSVAVSATWAGGFAAWSKRRPERAANSMTLEGHRVSRCRPRWHPSEKSWRAQPTPQWAIVEFET